MSRSRTAEHRDSDDGGWPLSTAVAWLLFTGARLTLDVIVNVHAGDRDYTEIVSAMAIAAAAGAAGIGLALGTLRSWVWYAGIFALCCAVLARAQLLWNADPGMEHWYHRLFLIGNLICLSWFVRHREALLSGAPITPTMADLAEEAPIPAALLPVEPPMPEPARATAAASAVASIHQSIVQAGGASLADPGLAQAEAARFGLALAEIRPEAFELYRTFLGHYNEDRVLTPDEENELAALARLLGLTDVDVGLIRG